MVTDFKEYERSIGARLRIVREEFKLKQGEVAEIFSLTRATWNRYENAVRVPDAEFIYKFAAHFRVNPSWILSGTGDMHAMPHAGSFHVGECLGKQPTPVELEVKEITDAIKRDSKLRNMVLALVRAATQKH